MKEALKILTVATKADNNLNILIKSLKGFNISFEIIGMNKPWIGFGTKTYLLKRYLEKSSLTHFLFVDAYDVLFLKNIDHIWNIYKKKWFNEIVFAAEKFCFPDIDLCDEYPEVNSPWCYLNSGCYLAPVNQFLELIRPYPIDQTINDQAYFTRIFLDTKKIILDVKCNLFQCLNFEFDGEFEYGKAFKNIRMGTEPCVIHGNGNTPLNRFYKYL